MDRSPRRCSCALLLLLALTATPTRAQEEADDEGFSPGGGLRLDVLYTNLDSRFEYDRRGIGNSFSLAGDAPLDDEEPGFEGLAWVELTPRWGLELGWFAARYRGRGAVKKPFVHEDGGFFAGDQVRVEAEVQRLRAGVRIRALGHDGEDGGVSLHVPIGLSWFSERVVVEERRGTSRGSGRIDAYSPYLGVAFDMPFEHGFGVEGELLAFAYALGHVDRLGHLDLSFLLYYEPVEHLRLHLGPRVLALDHHGDLSNDNDRTSDWTVLGIAFGVSLDL